MLSLQQKHNFSSDMQQALAQSFHCITHARSVPTIKEQLLTGHCRLLTLHNVYIPVNTQSSVLELNHRVLANHRLSPVERAPDLPQHITSSKIRVSGAQLNYST
jgi:hypothetical protein